MIRRLLAVLMPLMLLAGCTGSAVPAANASDTAQDASPLQMELKYAECFDVAYEPDGCALITIADEGQFLFVPEGVTREDTDDVTVLRAPLTNIYLADSAAMDLFAKADALSNVRLTSTKQSDWSLSAIREEMEAEHLLYAGKYSAPDYELLLEEGTTLAIENTMIRHSPETKEKLESLWIPVMVTRASYESHPLGRLEWIRLYGLLAGRQEAADRFFEAQEALFTSIPDAEDTARSVAFFYISPNGYVNIRRPADYVAKMITLAGGRYVFSDLETPDGDMRSTMNMQQEVFYEGAREADILIYNATIDGGMEELSELLAKGEWLGDFKAVREGNVWCTEMNLFQETSGVAGVIADLNTIVTKGADAEDRLTYLHRLR